MTKRRFLIISLALFLLAALGTPQAGATLLTLSDVSSNGTPYTMPEWLNADLDFVVVDTTLTLTVTNNTFDDPGSDQTAFDIREVYFNIPTDGSVTGLTLTAVWELDETGHNIDGNQKSSWNTVVDVDNKANGFGLFDVLIEGDTSSIVIAPADTGGVYSLAFVFSILGTGPFSDADFTTYMSEQFDHNTLGLAAGKFVSGGPGGDDSAYGLVIPEPTTIALFGLSGLFLLNRKRRA